MNLSRRTFLIVAGALPFVEVRWPHAMRIVVIDDEWRGRYAFDSNTRMTSLTGDAGWLWHEQLAREAMNPAQIVSGLTRGADAFIFARLAADIGMRTTQRALNDDAVIWTLERDAGRNVPAYCHACA